MIQLRGKVQETAASMVVERCSKSMRELFSNRGVCLQLEGKQSDIRFAL